jgi:hypothetical protein
MTLWKKIALISFFSGAGFALVAAVILASVVWYTSRPTPPKQWNTKTLVATFDEVNVEGDNHHFVFYYTVQNNGDSDYSQETSVLLHVAGKLKRSNSYTSFDQHVSIRTPIFIPAHKRVRVAIELNYVYPKTVSEKLTDDERREFRKQVKEYVKTELSNLDGFVVFDEIPHYEIDFPAGWDSEK